MTESELASLLIYNSPSYAQPTNLSLSVYVLAVGGAQKTEIGGTNTTFKPEIDQ